MAAGAYDLVSTASTPTPHRMKPTPKSGKSFSDADVYLKNGREAKPITFMSSASRVWIPRIGNNSYLTHTNAPTIEIAPSTPLRYGSNVSRLLLAESLRRHLTKTPRTFKGL